MKQSKYFFAGLLLSAVSTVLLALLTLSTPANATGEFTTTWKTDVVNSTDASLVIPAFGNMPYDYTIDWGDGTVQSNVLGTASHTYASPGTYIVKISGLYPRIHLNYSADAKKLMSVDAWGSNQWTSMRDAFAGAQNLTILASDAPDFSNTQSLQGMFAGATNLGGNFSNWNVSTIVDFSYMFQSATHFNEDISNWDMSWALNLEGMFYQAESFNQPISDWDVSRATNFNGMFRLAKAFNQPLNWSTANMTDARFMFQGATGFNQPVDSWDISALQQANSMFQNSGLRPENYDLLLTGWRATAGNNVVIDFYTTYCSGGENREYLVNTMNWTITDGGFDGSTCGPSDIQFVDQTDPSVDEKQLSAVIGTLRSVDVEPDQTYTYTLCSGQYPDNSFFAVVADELQTATALDYDNPQDENGDNIYEICIRSTSLDGHFVEKLFSVSVNDVEDPIVTVEEVTVEDGEVLGTNDENVAPKPTITTANDEDPEESLPQVLGASSEEEAAVLASTGLSTLHFIAIGAGLSVAALVVTKFVKTAHIYQLKR